MRAGSKRCRAYKKGESRRKSSSFFILRINTCRYVKLLAVYLKGVNICAEGLLACCMELVPERGATSVVWMFVGC